MRSLCLLLIVVCNYALAQGQDCPSGYIQMKNECFAAMGMMGSFLGGGHYCGSSEHSYKKARELLEGVRKDFGNGEAEYGIQSLRSFARECKVDLRKNFGVDESQIMVWEKRNNINRLTKLKDSIEDAVLFGEGEAVISRYESLALKTGQSVDADLIGKWKLQNRKTQEAESANCTSVDMRPEFGPVRDQDSIGWCYAYVAADLLSYKTGQKVSAVDVAVNYNDSEALLRGARKTMFNKDESEFEGGQIAKAVLSSAEKGLCLDRKLSSDDMGQMNLKAAIQSVEQIKSSKNKSMNPNLVDCDLRGFNRLFPSINTKDLFEIVQRSTKADFINKLVDKACQPRLKLPKETKVETVYFMFRGLETKSEKFREIDQQLTKKNPIGITVWAELFFKGEGGSHAMTIVGREWDKNKKQCLYIVRNSWGASCEGSNGQFEKCENGNIYISKGRLLKQMIFADYIQ